MMVTIKQQNATNSVALLKRKSNPAPGVNRGAAQPAVA